MSRKSQACILVILIFLSVAFKSYSQDSLLYPSLPPGITAPLIVGKTETGKSFSLAKVKSRYTLLYFYEVDCHLCALVTPQLKKLYESYHSIGLEVVAVPVEAKREEWLAYVADHALTWKNVLVTGNNLETLKKDYLLEVSPTFYLLDRRKTLLNQRMGRIEQVEEELNRRIR